MKPQTKKLFFSLFLVGLALSINAQVETEKETKIEKKEKTEKKEEIVIRKNKDGKSEKMVIVVDGDKITVNGKPVMDFKGKDIEVLRRMAPMMPGNPKIMFRGNGHDSDVEFFSSGNKAFLGVMSEKDDKGAKITEVVKESAAEASGLLKDDIIIKVADKKISTPDDLVNALKDEKPGDVVDITYLRNGKESKVKATLKENKSNRFKFDFDMDNFDKKFNWNQNGDGPFGYVFGPNKPKLGLQIQDVAEGKGVKVSDIDKDTPSEKSGLKNGDVITHINDKEISGVDDAKTAIKNLKEGESVSIKYNRDGKQMTTSIKIPKKIKTAEL